MNDFYNRAIKLLAQREHSRYELKRKLLKGQFEFTVEVEEVLDRLVAKNYQSDERFTAEYIRAKMQIWGANRIKQELKQKGVAVHIIDTKLAEVINVDEVEIAHQVLIKKYPTELPEGENGRAKVFRFLTQRGFNGIAIKNAINLYKENIN